MESCADYNGPMIESALPTVGFHGLSLCPAAANAYDAAFHRAVDPLRAAPVCPLRCAAMSRVRNRRMCSIKSNFSALRKCFRLNFLGVR